MTSPGFKFRVALSEVFVPPKPPLLNVLVKFELLAIVEQAVLTASAFWRGIKKDAAMPRRKSIDKIRKIFI
jgi:hypothetical protein